MLPCSPYLNHDSPRHSYSTLESSFSHTPPPPPSLRYGGATSNIVYGQKGRNKTAPKNLTSYTANRASTDLPKPRTSHSQYQPSSPSHTSSSDPTHHTEVLPSTPHSLVEFFPNLSIDQVVSRLKPLLDGTSGEREISIEGVSSDIVHTLQAKSRASELPGWENLRYYVTYISLVRTKI
jgi:hypothetical protein